MDEASDRVEKVLGAYVESIELGGPKPDVSHLSAAEQEELQELIELFEETKGVEFGLGREEGLGRVASARTEVSKILAQSARPELAARLDLSLRDALPPGIRIARDPTASSSRIGDLDIVAGWILGTFGGRVRVWLVGIDDGSMLETSEAWLRELGRAFRMFPDTVAIALVGKDLSCLLVQPEDCSPHIEVPSGSLMGRHYRRPIQPVGEAVSSFMRELIPYWDPIPALREGETLGIDVSPIAHQRARLAIEEQAAIGKRTRKVNPKRKALMNLGKREIDSLAELALGLSKGNMNLDDVEQRLGRLAKTR